MGDKGWTQIGSALDSELENFDKFMTARSINGEQKDTFTEKEIRKVEKILEKPVSERFAQENLLNRHIKRDM